MPVRQARTSLPQERKRASRRQLLARTRREAYGREVGLDPARDPVVHSQLVELWAEELRDRRQRWDDRKKSERALVELRAAMPDAVSGRDRERCLELLDEHAGMLADVKRPAWMRSADDDWLVDAQHELDDDELARLLSPAGYRADRDAALRAVRERRRKIRQRR